MSDAYFTDAQVDEMCRITPPAPFASSPLALWQAKQRAEKAADPPEPKPPKMTKAEWRAFNARRAEERAALIRYHSAQRRAAKLQRTPPWADDQAIRALYAKARALTVETGVEHHVDHQLPLQGELVSGLHVHTNMQIITGSENSRKKNRFQVE